jgi:hypothetical protein
MHVSKLTLGTGVLRDAVMRTHFPGDAGSVYGRTARAMSAICECWRCGGQLRAARPSLSVLMPLPGRVPSADREFSRALPRHKKIRVLQCHRGFHGWTCQGPELNFYVTRLSPKQKCRPAIRCSSPASPPVSRPGSTRRPRPATVAARGPSPPRAGRHASREKPGTGPHDTAGRHGTRRRGPHARAGNPAVGPACSSGA